MAAALLLALAACAPTPPAAPPAPPSALTLEPATFDALPGWAQDDTAAAIPALLRSCDNVLRLPGDRAIGKDGIGGVAADWNGPCAAARSVPPDDHAAARVFFETWFRPFRATAGGKSDGLFTGYYEAELKGSRTPSPRFKVPLYGRPADLVTVDLGQFLPDLRGQEIAGRVEGGRLKPYANRAEIDGGALKGKVPEVLWVADAVDAFILHIQGSGRVLLDDGSAIRVGFAGSNGHKFVGIGKVMLARGKVSKDDSSMQAIRAWLRANPAEAPALMAENPRYIFFRLIDGEGPIGAQGVALTAGRSMAVDPAFVPLGVPLWLDSVEPGGTPLRRVMVAQDTGSAIKGPVRGDFFWGTGEPALDKAGRMKSGGGYYLLLPGQRSNRLAAAAVQTRLAFISAPYHPER